MPAGAKTLQKNELALSFFQNPVCSYMPSFDCLLLLIYLLCLSGSFHVSFNLVAVPKV